MGSCDSCNGQGIFTSEDTQTGRRKGINVEMCLKMCQSSVLVEGTALLRVCEVRVCVCAGLGEWCGGCGELCLYLCVVCVCRVCVYVGCECEVYECVCGVIVVGVCV